MTESPSLRQIFRHAEAHPVRWDSVSRSFGDRDVIAELSLEIAAGEIVAILGASGCGKSTLLRLIGGLDRPTTGAITIGGEPVRANDERCAVAFQEPRLLPWRTVAGNIRYGLPHGTDKTEAAARVSELVNLVELEHATNLRPREISGGMAQRVSLARALARNPEVLLLDEPFGALDALTRLKMQDLLLRVHEVAPTTVFLVTHDVDEALQLADRIVVLASPGAGAPATISHIVDVPGERPRNRGSADLAEIKAQLLEELGVDAHTNASSALAS